ncbi:cyclic nucleotide-binding domain-containing protein [Mesorhizobium sp. BR1-1-16]|uniref:Crp/Fnr family transcriptional regulator n=1 Tax=Mesorhizobium sp. BR1-1-16 TaxID=2876653 RepID=UPI001CCC568F|nr:cyclic nucleotide-binding domain-containing protein [Mesorhizobium sp. BR1-1-16]MBZ9937388.1 cyclic nucleotide-binding domain-containing protein [Mesorhizobium sp. BR1-1-16]
MLDILSLFFGNRIDIPGHIGFLLMAVSLFLTNILWLRVFLILSFAFLIVYFALSPMPLYTGIAWMGLFILINLYRLKALLAARRVVDAATGGALLRDSLADLDDEELARLVEFGELVDLDDGAVLIGAGDAVNAIYLVATGKAQVEVGGVVAARLGRGAFVGEVAFLADAPSTATIRAAGPLQVIALDTEQLRLAGESDPRIAAGIYHAMGRALAKKLLATSRVRARA